MDIKTSSLETLKSFAYDTLVEIERHQGNLRAINDEIRLRNMPKIEPVAEEKKEE